jgi:hypothetical protein
MCSPSWARHSEALAFLHEAEALELDADFPAEPLAP